MQVFANKHVHYCHHCCTCSVKSSIAACVLDSSFNEKSIFLITCIFLLCRSVVHFACTHEYVWCVLSM